MKFNSISCYYRPHFIPFREGFVPTSVRSFEVTPERLFSWSNVQIGEKQHTAKATPLPLPRKNTALEGDE
jgi:hypothetical protein